MPEDQPSINTDLASFNAQIESISDGTTQFLQAHRTEVRRMWGKTLLIGLPIWITLWILFVWPNVAHMTVYNEQASLILIIPMILAILPFLIPISFYSTVSIRMDALYKQEVSQALGMTYTETLPLSTAEGKLFQSGDKGTGALSDIFTGVYRELPMRLYTFTFAINRGKHTDIYVYTCCELTFPGSVPELFVISNDIRYGLDWDQPGTHQLHTEGDFSQQFKAYVQDGDDIDGLRILEPNVMRDLMENYRSFGFECSGNRLVVFTTTHPNTKQGYKDLVALADSLSDLLIPEVAGVARSS